MIIAAPQDIYRLDIEDEKNSSQAIERLEQLKLLHQKQDKAILQLTSVVQEKPLSPFWLVKSLKTALLNAYACGLTSECAQVADALHLLEKVEAETDQIAVDM
jgi:hypothetical protein